MELSWGTDSFSCFRKPDGMATYLGESKKPSHTGFLTVLVKCIGKNNCVLCLLKMASIHHHTQQQEKSSQWALHCRWLQEGYQYSTPVWVPSPTPASLCVLPHEIMWRKEDHKHVINIIPLSVYSRDGEKHICKCRARNLRSCGQNWVMTLTW